jgi:hypothetical protein
MFRHLLVYHRFWQRLPERIENMRGVRIGIGIILCLLALCPAQAQLLFNLNPAGLIGAPGGSVTFNATLTNSGTDTIWLNGDSSGVSASGLTIDDTPYLNNFPLFLIGGDAATANLFTVNIDPSVAPGNYFGSFTIVGGADAFAQDILATQNFEVTLPAVSSVPEPDNFPLIIGLGFGMATIVGLRLCKRLPMT